MLVYLLALVLGANLESASGLSTIRLVAILGLVCAIGMFAWVQRALQGERIPQSLEHIGKGRAFYWYLWGSVGLGILLLNFFLWPAYRYTRSWIETNETTFAFFAPYVALGLVYLALFIAVLMVMRLEKEGWQETGTVWKRTISILGVLFVGVYLISIVWGWIFYVYK